MTGSPLNHRVALPVHPPASSVADTIHRRFFVAGIVSALTVGAGWGVWLLWQIGSAGDFTGVSIHAVNAHGHAQIFGWVGLFIMGFGYQALPRTWQTKLLAPGLAVVAFALMLAGIAVRTPAMALHEEAWALPTAMVGGAIQLVAIIAFVLQIAWTWHRSRATFEPYVAFIAAGLVFFVLQAVASLWHTWMTMAAVDREQLLWYVATYQTVLRDLQIHGLALMMILGVSMRILPGQFGLPRIAAGRAWTALVLLLLAVVGETVLFVVYRWTDRQVFAAALLLPWLMLAAGALLIPWRWKLWRPLPVTDRSSKFIRAAYGWLALSMAMLLLLPVYQVISGIAFSHAYYGAIRHAITVGFISMMIMGVGAKIVPRFAGADPETLPSLRGPFVLINVGCFLRVGLQILTDWHAGFFLIVGISGILELAALAWWGLHLVGVMWTGRQDKTPDAGRSLKWINASHRVGEVLGRFPQTRQTFAEMGYAVVRNPLLRWTVARRTTLAQAAAMAGIPLSRLIVSLNEAAGLERPELTAADLACLPPQVALTVRGTCLPVAEQHRVEEVAG